MYSISVIANAFLEKSEMSHKKLQKLCFYAQSWHLYYFDTEITDSVFQAWVHGPVSPELYQVYKDYGWNQIEKNPTHIELNEQAQNIVDEVYRVYGELSGDELEALTHSEMPWKNARGKLPPYEASYTQIKNIDMKDHCNQIMNEIQPNV